MVSLNIVVIIGVAGPLGLVGRELAHQTKTVEQHKCGYTPFLIMTELNIINHDWTQHGYHQY